MPSANRLRLLASKFLFFFSLVILLLSLGAAPVFYQRVVSRTVPEVSPPGSDPLSNQVIANAAAARGMDLPTYALYYILLTIVISLGFLAVALLIAWKARGQWFLWFTAFILTFYPAGGGPWRFTQVAGMDSVVLGIGSLLWPFYFLFLYLFPNGKALPRVLRWPVGILMGLHFLLQLVALLSFWSTRFPVITELITPGLIERVFQFGPVILLNFLLVLAAQIIRYWRFSMPIERLQTRWFVFGLAAYIGLSILITAPVGISLFGDYGYQTDAGNLLALLIPAAIGISILRFRLWDIDVIIRRTVVYGAVTAILALVYFGCVVTLQQIIRAVTGQNSPAAIVISTLVIAALFSPLRGRIQRGIDRRFFRQKYDSELLVQHFSARLRAEVNLEQISLHLVAATDDALQPEGVSLWIKGKGE